MLFSNITVFNSDGEILPRHFVLVEGEKIRYLGLEDPRSLPEFEEIAEAEERYDGSNKVMIPGFVNAHCHVPMTLLRGYGEGLALHDWLEDRIYPFEDHMTEEDMYWGSLLGIAEMLQSGVTSFNDMYMRIEGIGRAVLESGIKANLGRSLAGGPNDKFKLTAAYRETEKALELSKTSNGLLVIDAALHAEYSSAPSLAGELLDYAKERKLRMQVHLSETLKEHEECKIRHQGKTPTEYFADLGLFDLPTVAAHGVYLEDSDLEILRNYDVTLCHCPTSNLKLGSGIARLRAWKEYGIRISLGTDGASSNNNLNMLEEITLASYVQKGVERDPLFLSTAELLKMASFNGALSQGRSDTGSLAAGMAADLTIVDFSAPHMQPVYDPTDNLFTTAQSSDIALTMVNGKVLYRDGSWPTLDIEQIIRQAQRIRDEKLELIRSGS
ncbi:MAG TPA: amidohydrolase [Oscillospiraceae bacterium]|jgi:5-methylthioadenosine/S-adenosylhomocysteine deaminase|nr:amidohydrolase [Oscillospiraceae bacterium]